MTTTATRPPTPQTTPALAPRTAGTPNPTTAPPGSLARLSTPALELARSEALRDADVLAMGLRAGFAPYRAAAAVCELRQLRAKIDALSAELRNRGEVTA